MCVLLKTKSSFQPRLFLVGCAGLAMETEEVGNLKFLSMNSKKITWIPKSYTTCFRKLDIKACKKMRKPQDLPWIWGQTANRCRRSPEQTAGWWCHHGSGSGLEGLQICRSQRGSRDLLEDRSMAGPWQFECPESGTFWQISHHPSVTASRCVWVWPFLTGFQSGDVWKSRPNSVPEWNPNVSEEMGQQNEKKGYRCVGPT